MKAGQEREPIRSSPYPNCYMCGGRGSLLYQGLRDRLFGAPGWWDLKKCPSAECGLIWLDPIPTPGDLGKAYENYFTHVENSPHPDARLQSHLRRAKLMYRRVVQEGYLEIRYGYRTDSLSAWKKRLGLLLFLDPRRRVDLDFRVMCLPQTPRGRLLDVGFGDGATLKLMQDLGWEVEGVDIDLIAVEQAESQGLAVHLGSLESRNYPDNHFDAVTMSHLVEHVHDPLLLFKESYRILKPTGRLVVATPNSESWGHSLFKAHWLHLDPPRHLHIFNVRSLNALAQRSGFRSAKLKTTIRNAGGVFMMSRSIQSTGSAVWHQRQPWKVRARAKRMSLIEWAMLKVDPTIGEEIALIADK